MNSKLAWYIVKRLLLAIVTIWLIITLTFFTMNAVPGGPFNREKALSPEVIENLEAKYGLDKPVHEQYFTYLGNLLRLDFGPSLLSRGRDVIDIIWDGFKTSAMLGITAAAMAIVIGVTLGCLSAVYRDKWVDKVIQVLTTASVAMPAFIVASLLLIVFCVEIPIFPANGSTFDGLILPTVTLSLYPMAYITRLMRSSMLDAFGQDYIRTARAKGVMQGSLIFKHAMKNSLIPVITYAGPMVAYILTGSLVVEQIFVVPGLGSKFVKCIIDRDYMLIMGTTIFLATLVVLMTFISDMLYKVVDPRIDFN